MFMLEVDADNPAPGDDNAPEEAPLLDSLTDKPVISLHAITGSFGGSTIRVMGSAAGKPLQILVDSGSTHNFLDITTARKLGCHDMQLPPLNVGMDNNQILPCNLACHGFQWNLQGQTYSADILLISLSSFDLILGAQWLLRFGDVDMNFDKLYLKFYDGEILCELYGSREAAVSIPSSSRMNKLLEKEKQVASIHLCSLAIAPTDSTGPSVNDPVQHPFTALLQEFRNVFAE